MPDVRVKPNRRQLRAIFADLQHRSRKTPFWRVTRIYGTLENYYHERHRKAVLHRG